MPVNVCEQAVVEKLHYFQEMRALAFFAVFSTVYFLTACGSHEPGTESDSVNVAIADSLKLNAPAVCDTLPIEARLCVAFMDIANYIDSQGYVCDSTRLTTVYTELADNKKLFGRKHIFYVCEPAETCIADQDYHKFDSLIRMNHQPVIEYFFTSPTKVNDYYMDGIVEQWELNDTAAARLAAEQIINTEMGFGHNSPPMVCCLDTRMYIFRSRSTPGMYAVLPIFREFVARNGASVVARENGWK